VVQKRPAWTAPRVRHRTTRSLASHISYFVAHRPHQLPLVAKFCGSKGSRGWSFLRSHSLEIVKPPFPPNRAPLSETRQMDADLPHSQPHTSFKRVAVLNIPRRGRKFGIRATQNEFPELVLASLAVLVFLASCSKFKVSS
jgi:hypothetical protein